MRHVLVFHGDPSVRQLLAVAFDREGYAVTKVATIDDALMTLRAALHPIVTFLQLDPYPQPPPGSFFQRVSDQPELYGQHRFVAMHARTLSEDEQKLLADVGVSLVGRPISIERILEMVARTFASLP